MNTTVEAHTLVANLTESLKSAADCLSALSKQITNQAKGGTVRRVKGTRKQAQVRVGRRGRRPGSTKLGQDKEAQIVELLNRPGVPIPVAAIAKAFGVSRPTIYNIRDKSNLDVRKRNRRATNSIVDEIKSEMQKNNQTQEQQAAAS